MKFVVTMKINTLIKKNVESCIIKWDLIKESLNAGIKGWFVDRVILDDLAKEMKKILKYKEK